MPKEKLLVESIKTLEDEFIKRDRAFHNKSKHKEQAQFLKRLHPECIELFKLKYELHIVLNQEEEFAFHAEFIKPYERYDFIFRYIGDIWIMSDLFSKLPRWKDDALSYVFFDLARDLERQFNPVRKYSDPFPSWRTGDIIKKEDVVDRDGKLIPRM